MNLIIKLWSFLTRGELVWLQDTGGTVTLSIARINPFGEKRAQRWWPFDIRNVLLLPNGEIKDGLYVSKWKPYKG